ncbi:MAG: glycosyltransferase family 2 protein [bacterium]|nr:glycosyltransferase family 2 protein [bacterium]
MAEKIDISVIVLNYKTKELSVKCVESIFKFTKGLDFEVILVDNNSLDGSKEHFRDFAKKFNDERLKVFANTVNSGFTGGNNFGLKKSRGEYILFLNSDTELMENSIEKCIKFLKTNPGVGAIGCQLKNLDGTLQRNGGHFPTLLKVKAWMLFLDDLPIVKDLFPSYHPPASFFAKSHYQDWLTGAFFLMPRGVLNEVGGWDDDYFMYVEDVDLCWRIKKAGYKVYYFAGTAIKHIGSASSSSDMSILRELKNLKLFYRKNLPSWQMPFLVLFLMLGSLLRLILFRKGVYAKAITSI